MSSASQAENQLIVQCDYDQDIAVMAVRLELIKPQDTRD